MPERKVYRLPIRALNLHSSGVSIDNCYRSVPALSVELTGLKNKSGFEWLKEIDSQLSQQAIADCKRAFDNFFQKRALFPKFKKKPERSTIVPHPSAGQARTSPRLYSQDRMGQG